MIPILTIIICTRNRWQSLKKTLSPILYQVTKLHYEKLIEIIVVDNNSSDKTSSVVQSAQALNKKVNLHYIFVKMIGISYARNAGIKESSGKSIAFIDDDTIISRNWCLRSIKLITLKNYGIFIGKLILHPSTRRCKIIQTIASHDLLWSVGISNLGCKSFSIKTHSFVLINNSIINKTVFDQIGLFDTRFGNYNESSGVFGGEDIDFMERAFRAHIPMFYESSLIAKHKILAYKLNWDYMKWRYFANGIEIATFNIKYQQTKSRIILSMKLLAITYFQKILIYFLSKRCSSYIKWLSLRKSYILGYLSIR